MSDSKIDFKSEACRECCEEVRKKMVSTQEEIIELLSGIVEFRSHETGKHIHRVSELSYQICIAAGYDDVFCEIIKIAAPLHDIGKVGIPDSILNKPDKLTEEEYSIMKTHTTMGEDMLSNSTNHVILTGAIIAGSHHEHWNGSGYPLGLEGPDIPLEGRIVAMADVFDALVSKRCYKDKWSFNDTMEYMIAENGHHFDPFLTLALFSIQDKVKEIFKIK